MSAKSSVCLEMHADLLATAMGDAGAVAVRRVEDHLGRCAACRGEFDRYQAIDRVVATLRSEPAPGQGVVRARERLEACLADLRNRLLTYRIFPTPFGNILIARSEYGVSSVEYLERGATVRASRLSRLGGLELAEDDGEMEQLYRELREYLEGKRTRFDWPVDLRLARSEFHRTVLRATAKVPYGAVASYAGIAWQVGQPKAVRAVAQALRWNPLPIVVPCHRIVGSSGSLTGYAGDRIGRKRTLLGTEGVPTVKRREGVQVVRAAMYVRYPDDEAYCLPTCPSLSSMALARLTLFSSRQCAEAAGLAPCTTCRPDLHPIR